MVDPAINVAIFIIWWWMAFFVMLPIGVRRVDPADAAQGHDAGAPAQPMIWKKAFWAACAGAVLWALTALMIWFDPFHIRT
jgi:predicted secreted protein